MGPIAKRSGPRPLASAQGQQLALSNIESNRTHVAAAMGSIAKWLILRTSASAPVVGIRFQFDEVGLLAVALGKALIDPTLAVRTRDIELQLHPAEQPFA